MSLYQQEASLYEGLDRSFPADYNPGTFTTDHSGKLQVLGHLLAHMHRSGDRVVLVSNYTQVRCFKCAASLYQKLEPHRIDGTM